MYISPCEESVPGIIQIAVIHLCVSFLAGVRVQATADPYKERPLQSRETIPLNELVDIYHNRTNLVRLTH